MIKACVPKMAQINASFSKIHFSIWVLGGAGPGEEAGGGGIWHVALGGGGG